MKKTLPKWAFGVLSFVGFALIASMALNWVDFGGMWQRSGIRLAWEDNHWLFLVPIAGATLLATAASRSPYTRLAAIFAGLVVAGYVLFSLAHSIVQARLDTWLILGGAGMMLAGASEKRGMWRALGGIAVLAGFIAPWVDYPLFKVLRHDLLDNGVTNVLWAIPVGGVLGLFGAGNSKEGGRLSALGGSLVYGSLLLVIGVVAYVMFGYGAWLALGASAMSLVLGVLVKEVVPGSSEDA